MRYVLISAFVTAVGLAAPAFAQERSRGERAEQASADPSGLLDLLPSDVTTEAVLKTSQGEIAYRATAGTLALRGSDGKVAARIFYTAYRAKDRVQDRPVTFAFNGGPGAASAYLHLGLVGPKILPFEGANRDGTRPELRDNPESWLAFTDLVLIDPVGTGWSRAVNDDAAARFYGVRQDAESLAKAIALYVQNNSLLAAPKYLLGESYGGFRAAKVALALKNNQNMVPAGILMVSPLMEGRFVFGPEKDPLAAALQFPSLVAAQMERKGTFTTDGVMLAERFANRDYVSALIDPPEQGADADAIYDRIATMTGLATQDVVRTRGFVGEIYAKQAGGEGQILSPYDASVPVPDAYPEASYTRNDDPILEGYTRAYGSAFAAYARDVLGFKTEMTYSLLNEEVNRRWEWNGGRGGDARVSASIANDLRDLLSVIPSFRVMVVHGYSDILTPYGASRFVLDHLPEAIAKDRTELRLYRGGHMFYTNDAERSKMFEDAARFYGRQSGR